MNLGEHWTRQEDERLTEFVSIGGTWEEIGRELARSPRGVQARAKKLKLSAAHMRWAQYAGKTPAPKPQERPDDVGLRAKR